MGQALNAIAVAWAARTFAPQFPRRTSEALVMRNNFERLLDEGLLLDAVVELRASGIPRPTLRAIYYLMVDRGLLNSKPATYTNFDSIVSEWRDAGLFPYGLLADDAGTDERGLTAPELKAYIKSLRSTNVAPQLVDGKLVAVLIEKAGLVPLISNAIRLYGIPVGSPGGMIRKEWEWSWLLDLTRLSKALGAKGIRLIYLGDGDTDGWNIADVQRQFVIPKGFSFDHLAVRPEQLAELRVRHPLLGDEIHIDGYIALTGIDVFTSWLLEQIGLAKE